MIKFKIDDNVKKPVYGLGISEGNVEYLKQGRPIAVDLAKMGGPDIEVFIFYGETEEEMTKQLMPYISKETKIYKHDTEY